MSRSISDRAARVEPFLAMDVMSAAIRREREGKPVVYMCVGEPGTPAPSPVREVAAKAVADGRFGYTEALGIRPLREAIAAHYQAAHGIAVSPERIVVTTGSSVGFDLAFLACFNPGDRVAIASPGYPPYRAILAALDLEAVEIEVGPATRWALTAEAIEAAHAARPLKGVLIASPANPTGTMILEAELAAICATCRRLGIWLISDEIYHRLVWIGAEKTALAFDDDVIVLNSFSKYYSMTGWRVGWMVVPERLARTIERLVQNMFISVPDLSQRAAVAAFDPVSTAELDVVKAGYGRNRELLMRRLPQMGFSEILPMDGAFYVYADVSRFTNDSMAFAAKMLDEAGVAATPGPDFDRSRGHRYMRFSFAGHPDKVAEAVERLEHWLK